MANDVNDWQVISPPEVDDWKKVEPKKATILNRLGETGSDLLKTLAESGEDTGRGLAEGATFGGADELMGGIHALGGLATGQAKSTDELKDLYRKYQKLEEEKQLASKARSPYLFGAGEIAGAVGTGAATGGLALEGSLAKGLGSIGAKEAFKAGGKKLLSGAVAKEVGAQGLASAAAAAPYGAAQGALSSQGNLDSPEGKNIMLHDSESGALSGGLVGGALGAGGVLGKAGYQAGKELLESGKNKLANNKGSPFLRQTTKAYDMGENGINPQNQETFGGTLDKPGSLENSLSTKETREGSSLVDKYFEGDKLLSNNVGNVVNAFVDESGNSRALNIAPTVKQKASDFLKYAQNDPSIALNDHAKQVFEVLQSLDTINPTAKAVMSTRDNLYKLAESYTMKDPNVAGLAKDIANSLGHDLKQQVPGYAKAAERLKNYRTLFGEGTLAGDTPLDMFPGRISRTKDSEGKLLDKFRGMISHVSGSGEQGRYGQESFTNVLKNLKELEGKDPEIFKQINMTPEKIESFVKNASDDSNAVKLMRGYEPRSGEGGTIKGLVTGGISSGKGMILNRARNLGWANKSISDFSAKLAKATDDQLMSISVKLPEHLRKSMVSAIQNKDVAGKNAVVFSLMQNPEYRKLIQPEDIMSPDTDEVK